ncbi:hypothetical protein EVG20_g6347 [Dentipellis fragilis]|uniref:Signal recognition particle SRP19 subunit n=1 Tax=Dentipellis fragilis TaxID=205917 RepID=A0A4Y9YQQ8_9AGAM|nr:hypothetical protein EVG20_g6347 [Dentipellis fragilis]
MNAGRNTLPGGLHTFISSAVRGDIGSRGGGMGKKNDKDDIARLAEDDRNHSGVHSPMFSRMPQWVAHIADACQTLLLHLDVAQSDSREQELVVDGVALALSLLTASPSSSSSTIVDVSRQRHRSTGAAVKRKWKRDGRDGGVQSTEEEAKARPWRRSPYADKRKGQGQQQRDATRGVWLSTGFVVLSFGPLVPDATQRPANASIHAAPRGNSDRRRDAPRKASTQHPKRRIMRTACKKRTVLSSISCLEPARARKHEEQRERGEEHVARDELPVVRALLLDDASARLPRGRLALRRVLRQWAMPGRSVRDRGCGCRVVVARAVHEPPVAEWLAEGFVELERSVVSTRIICDASSRRTASSGQGSQGPKGVQITSVSLAEGAAGCGGGEVACCCALATRKQDRSNLASVRARSKSRGNALCPLPLCASDPERVFCLAITAYPLALSHHITSLTHPKPNQIPYKVLRPCRDAQQWWRSSTMTSTSRSPRAPSPIQGRAGAILEEIGDDGEPISDEEEEDDDGDEAPPLRAPAAGPASTHIQGPPSVTDITPYKKWTCIYPIYIDAKQPYGTGTRRISRSKSIWFPLSKDIAEASNRLGLGTLHEVNKSHPRDWENPGRVRVQWKKEGRLVNPSIRTSACLCSPHLTTLIFSLCSRPKPPYTYPTPAAPPHPPKPAKSKSAPSKASAKGKSSGGNGGPKPPVQSGRPLPVPPEPLLPPLASRVSAYSPALPSGVLIDTVKAGMNAQEGAGPAVGAPGMGGKGKRKVVRVRQ